MKNNDKWDYRHLELAKHISTWSADPSRKVGAVAIGSKKQVLSQGFNGFCRGFDDSKARYDDRELKLKLVVHAEANAIYNAAHSGVNLDGSTLYVWGCPICHECAKAIIQCGIRRVVMPWAESPKSWIDSIEFGKELFDEAGVVYDRLADTILV